MGCYESIGQGHLIQSWRARENFLEVKSSTLNPEGKVGVSQMDRAGRTFYGIARIQFYHWSKLGIDFKTSLRSLLYQFSITIITNFHKFSSLHNTNSLFYSSEGWKSYMGLTGLKLKQYQPDCVPLWRIQRRIHFLPQLENSVPCSYNTDPHFFAGCPLRAISFFKFLGSWPLFSICKVRDSGLSFPHALNLSFLFHLISLTQLVEILYF